MYTGIKVGSSTLFPVRFTIQNRALSLHELAWHGRQTGHRTREDVEPASRVSTGADQVLVRACGLIKQQVETKERHD